jgi:hypothetical protein
MSSSNIVVNDATTTKPTSTKNLWCRDARANNIISILGFNPFHQGKGFHVRKCSYGDECRGAHCCEEIKTLPHIHHWNRVDKSKYNFPEMFVHIISVINKDKVKVSSCSPFTERLSKISTMNFIEVIQLWHDLSCHYRKISKELPKKRDWKSSALPISHTSGYAFADDVPGFYLDSKFEDNAWAFDRMTRFCNTHKMFKEKISKREGVTIWEICLGESNCKEGIHHEDESICIENFLTGKCSCMTIEDFNRTKENLEQEITDLSELVSSSKPKQRDKINATIASKRSQLSNLQRKIHYTDSGMKPWDIQWAEHLVCVEEEHKKAEEEESKRVKPAWDHSMVKTCEAKVGKVTKISLKIGGK